MRAFFCSHPSSRYGYRYYCREKLVPDHNFNAFKAKTVVPSALCKVHLKYVFSALTRDIPSFGIEERIDLKTDN